MPPFLQIQFIIGDLGYTFNNEIGNLIMHVKWFKGIVYIDNICSLVHDDLAINYKTYMASITA